MIHETPEQTAHRLWHRVVATIDATEGECSALMDGFTDEWNIARETGNWRDLCGYMCSILRDAGETVDWMHQWEVAS